MKYKTHHNFIKHKFSSNTSGLIKKNLTSMYKFMLRLRMVEEKILSEYHPEDKMRCPVHLCIGQEGVSAVLNLILKKNDYLFSHHRSHGYYLAKKCDLKKLIAELYGKSTGSNKGLAGSQDISSKNDNFYAGAIVAGGIGISVGTGFANKYKKINSTVVCCFGEAATEQGIFWEAINYASLKKLPIIFICENNVYSTYSHSKYRVAKMNLCEKVKSFGMEAKQVFGNDVILLHKEIKKAYKNSKKGPFFLESMTYRQNSHVGPENDSPIYRSELEIEQWKKLCPIKNFKKILDKKINLPAEKIKNKISSEIDQAFNFARKSKFFNLKENDWEKLNYSNKSTKKIKELKKQKDFIHKLDTLPEPY